MPIRWKNQTPLIKIFILPNTGVFWKRKRLTLIELGFYRLLQWYIWYILIKKIDAYTWKFRNFSTLSRWFSGNQQNTYISNCSLWKKGKVIKMINCWNDWFKLLTWLLAVSRSVPSISSFVVEDVENDEISNEQIKKKTYFM